ncbi:MAG TPA: hypothetical protein VEX68_08760, partial [Bryobacteraceae bacterium]|nr:hypothetical protein [Bryobacteraceae bacterium]
MIARIRDELGEQHSGSRERLPSLAQRYNRDIVPNELAQWWRPGLPSERISGMVSDEGDAGVRLILDGHFTV